MLQSGAITVATHTIVPPVHCHLYNTLYEIALPTVLHARSQSESTAPLKSVPSASALSILCYPPLSNPQSTCPTQHTTCPTPCVVQQTAWHYIVQPTIHMPHTTYYIALHCPTHNPHAPVPHTLVQRYMTSHCPTHISHAPHHMYCNKLHGTTFSNPHTIHCTVTYYINAL